MAQAQALGQADYFSEKKKSCYIRIRRVLSDIMKMLHYTHNVATAVYGTLRV